MMLSKIVLLNKNSAKNVIHLTSYFQSTHHKSNVQKRVLSSVNGRIASSKFVADWLLIVIV